LTSQLTPKTGERAGSYIPVNFTQADTGEGFQIISVLIIHENEKILTWYFWEYCLCVKAVTYGTIEKWGIVE
jgi:hypothetical protein